MKRPLAYITASWGVDPTEITENAAKYSASAFTALITITHVMSAAQKYFFWYFCQRSAIVSFPIMKSIVFITPADICTVVYQKYLNIGLYEIGIALAMGLFMVLGTMAGKKIIEKMVKEKFTTFVTILLGAIGILTMIN